MSPIGTGARLGGPPVADLSPWKQARGTGGARLRDRGEREAGQQAPALSDEMSEPEAAGPPLHGITGVWQQDAARSESLCPFMAGLFPYPIDRIACAVADRQRVTLRICVPAENTLEVVDKTAIGGRYSTVVKLGGPEVEKKTRGGRKTYMLSGFASRDAASGAEMSTIRCRMDSRGEGWATVQERYVDPSDPHTLVERNILERPDEANVVVTRYFTKTEEDVETAYQKAMASVR